MLKGWFRQHILKHREIGAALVRVLHECVFVCYVTTALFLLISLFSYTPSDAGWHHAGFAPGILNAGGAAGAWLADFLLSLFGITTYIFPFCLGLYGYIVYRAAPNEVLPSIDQAIRWSGFLMALVAATGLTDRFMVRPQISLPEGYGGMVGAHVSNYFHQGFGTPGMSVLLVALLLIGFSLAAGKSWASILDLAGNLGLRLIDLLDFSRLTLNPGWIRRHRPDPELALVDTPPVGERIRPLNSVKTKARVSDDSAPAPSPLIRIQEPRIPPDIDESEDPAPSSPTPLTRTSARKSVGTPPKGHPLDPLPGLDLLNSRVARIRGYTHEQLESMSRQLEAILDDFGVEVQVMEVHPGPVITRFEIQPAAGVKVSRISGLAKDLARTLSVTSVRVVEIIPGKTVIGLEIPNEERETVLLHSVLSSPAYRDTPSPLTLTLGKDISGGPVVANLARMPHLLVAGTTGSGKSVAVNVMILSILYKAKPEDVRLIMIDPKMLELSVYEGIPHLLTPVVTDMREAANALRWCVAEMERRYKLMSVMGVRNISGFNQKVQDALDAGEPLKDPLWAPDLFSEHEVHPDLAPLPFIVIVIDELADMMMIVGKKVEELIARLAQKARAAGLHLILATQRPSVDVITGLIKANIPTRIAFQVSSKIDSRTILDQGGAESLLGNGDMLYLPPGTGLPMRAHGAFVSDDEVHQVVEYLKMTGPSNYIEEITRFSEEAVDGGSYRGSGGGDSGEESDALYDEAVRFVTESRKASISGVQRRFKIGYNRAARMIEDMEMAGVVGPAETNGSRAVLAPRPPED